MIANHPAVVRCSSPFDRRSPRCPGRRRDVRRRSTGLRRSHIDDVMRSMLAHRRRTAEREQRERLTHAVARENRRSSSNNASSCGRGSAGACSFSRTRRSSRCRADSRREEHALPHDTMRAAGPPPAWLPGGQMTIERQAARDLRRVLAKRPQEIGLLERGGQPRREVRGTRRIPRHEKTVLAWRQPLANPADVERDGGHTERAGFETNQPEWLRPRTRHREQARAPQPVPSRIAFLPSGERGDDTEPRRQTLPHASFRAIADHDEMNRRQDAPRRRRRAHQQIAALQGCHPSAERDGRPRLTG